MVVELRDLITRTENVLFDFDGPICRLYAGHGAYRAFDNLVAWLADRGMDGLLSERDRASGDTHVVLHAVHRAHPGSTLEIGLEARLTEEELSAAGRARPTPYADRLIRTWHATGAGLAVATNNAPEAAARYLELRGLAGCFAGRVHGRRTDEVRSLKPDPDCIHRALDSLGATARTALMIGDTPTDCEAARKAGVPFLGYGSDERRSRRLREAGARFVVDSLEPVADLVWNGAR